MREVKPNRIVEVSQNLQTSNVGFEQDIKPSRSVKTMIFADIEAYSKITDDLTTQFVEVFHGAVSRMIDKLPSQPSFVNTWGDSFFAVFEDLESALQLALAMRDHFTDSMTSKWLPTGKMDIRISLHAGPVYEEFDQF